MAGALARRTALHALAGRLVGEKTAPTTRLQLVPVVAVGWLAVVGALAVLSAVASISISTISHRIADNQSYYGPIERSGIIFNVCAVTLAMVVSVGVGLLRPAWWRRTMVALALIPIPVLLWTSRNAPAGLTLLAVLIPAIWLGRELARVALGEGDAATAWIVGGGLGVGLVATLGFGLGLVGLLRPLVLWPLLAAATLWLVAACRRRLRDDVAALGRWLRRPVGRSPLAWFLAAFALTFFWLNLCGAMTPETVSDAVRQRMPTAVQFAETGRLAADDPELSVAKDTAVGEATYAVGLAIGPLQTAKLLAFATGLLCAAAVFGLGRCLGGNQAGGLAAFAFYTMPIVVFLSRTAYLDLFTTLYAVTAALIFLRREKPDWRAAVAAGFCIGLGVGVKINFGYVAVGLAVLLGLLALRRGGPSAAVRLVAVLTGAALLIAAAPLVRSALLTGHVPGLALATASLTRRDGTQPAAMFDLADFGFGRSLADLARLPFDLTLASSAFEWIPSPWGPSSGLIGYLLLGLAPLIVIARPRWRVLALCTGGAVAMLLWFYTAQYLRYALPVLAMLTPIAGVACASARGSFRRPGMHTALGGLVLALAVAAVAVQLRVPTFEHNYALGQQGRDDYLSHYFFERNIDFQALHLLDTQPDAKRALALPDPARLYTHVRLSSPESLGPGNGPVGTTDPATALARLDEGDYSYIVFDRRRFLDPYLLVANWDETPVLTEEFLRRNTMLVGGGDDTYVYRLLPPDQRGEEQPWARGHELLPNGGLASGQGGVPEDWAATGQPRYDATAHAVLASPRDYLTTTIPVTPNVQYLLSHDTRSADGETWARLRVTWRDTAGAVVGDTIEEVPASPRGYHTFSMLATAPTGAATATIYAQADSGEVWFTDLSFRTVQPDGAAASGARRE